MPKIQRKMRFLSSYLSMKFFKGTNYNDRLFGAKAVVHKLAEKSCITFITTHDFELCEVPEKKVSNYHFTENYDGDLIVFDHKIRSANVRQRMHVI